MVGVACDALAAPCRCIPLRRQIVQNRLRSWWLPGWLMVEACKRSLRDEKFAPSPCPPTTLMDREVRFIGLYGAPQSTPTLVTLALATVPVPLMTEQTMPVGVVATLTL